MLNRIIRYTCYKTTKSKLIILNNIDNYLTIDQYQNVMQVCEQLTVKYDIYFIVCTSKRGYQHINKRNLNAINVFNDVIFNFVNINLIREYIENHYPYYKNFSNDEIIDLITPIIHDIGIKEKPITIASNTILKILNESEGINTPGIGEFNELEARYIQ